ncbi:hypothetical protein SALWKB12_0549 [Snodgrassella communis]|nr:hypothetical protein SALWKB12_2119 [Snodgrassella communis]KDN11804.1 hypothetical protein SALWKB12_1726 [Snodgrassella communis]KDN11973.1 hypothetical protein SALWKB12_1895 [Snodgrassella communis]KDN13694.1 hypothetical protein SALWKB12_0549 [Snodgrassella communis]
MDVLLLLGNVVVAGTALVVAVDVANFMASWVGCAGFALVATNGYVLLDEANGLIQVDGGCGGVAVFATFSFICIPMVMD